MNLSQYLPHEDEAAGDADEPHERGDKPVVPRVYPPERFHPAEEPFHGVPRLPQGMLVEDRRSTLTRFHTPIFSHLLSLLLAVVSSPYLGGMSIHRHPVMRTKSIPLTIARSSALGLPSLALAGRKGSILLHLTSSSCWNFIDNENRPVHLNAKDKNLRQKG